MINKDLLFSQGLQGWGAYTHIVLVENPSNWIFRGFNATGGYGSIVPGAYFDYDTPIEKLGVYYSSAYDETQLKTGGYFLPDPKLIYLGRSDTKKLMRNPSKYSEEEGYVYWRHKVLFTEEDLGKEVPIWLSYTPPRGSKSLFLKQLFNLSEGCLDVQQQSAFHQQRFNNRCHYYQRLRSGWCNRIRQILRASFAGGNQDHQTSDWGRDYGIVSGLCNIGRVIYLGSLRQHFLEHYKKLSNRLSNGRNVSTLWRFVLSLCASHTMGGAYA